MPEPSDDLTQAIRLLTQQVQGLQKDVSAVQAVAACGAAPAAPALAATASAEQRSPAPAAVQPVRAKKAKKGKNKEKKPRREADALGTALGKVLQRAQERGTAGNNLLGAVEKI
eukprot:6474178-Alexandrium_andersonii.AAC.1